MVELKNYAEERDENLFLPVKISKVYELMWREFEWNGVPILRIGGQRVAEYDIV